MLSAPVAQAGVSTTSVSPSHSLIAATTAADRCWEAAPVEKDSPVAVVGLVDDHDEPLRLHDLPRLGMLVELEQSHREAVRVGVVLAVIVVALLQQLGRPRTQRQAASRC